MDQADVLNDAFGRIGPIVHSVCDGRSADELTTRPEHEGNSPAWLIWHLSRVQDDHVSDAAGTTQVWIEEGFADRFDLGLPVEDTGYGHSSGQVAKVVAAGEKLAGYYDAVAARTTAFVIGLSATDLDRIVDEAWDPPVTLGVRLVSVIDDCLQHAGQAAYALGLAGSE